MTFPDRIFLVGMPGAGKSTFGKFLAKEIGYQFIDLDTEIERHEARSISTIFSEDGESRFREIEFDLLRKQVNKKTVVATGGGAPCFFDNMTWMNANGLTVFLNPGLEVLIQRTQNTDHRPLLKNEVKERLEELLENRMQFYTQADMESGSSESREILAELRDFIKHDARN